MLPLFYLLLFHKIKRPNKLFLLMMGWYALIFFIAAIYQNEFFDEGIRRIISFIIFMSLFSYMFVTIDNEMIESFKIAIVAIGLYFSLLSIYNYFMLGGSKLGFEAKDIIGSQRFGFIYIMGIWLIYSYQRRGKLYLAIKYLILLILLIGLFLTFSRSSIVGLMGSVGFFVLIKIFIWFKRPRLPLLAKALFSIIVICLLIVLLHEIVPVSFTFYQERLFSFLMDSSVVADNLNNPEASGGTRVYILGKIFEYSLHNPLTGSGYLGVWIFHDYLFGSSHNQYADVLFRTGLYGFLAYIYLLLLLIKFLYTNDKALFWGLIGVLFYGMFHETFKESHGAFVLAFLLGMMSQSWRKIEGSTGNKKYIAGTGKKCNIICEDKSITTQYQET